MFNMKKITAMLMTSMLLVGTFGMSVMADEPSATPTNVPVTITKNLVMDDAVETYPAMNFKFTVTQVTTGSVTGTDGTTTTIATDSVPLTVEVNYKGTETDAITPTTSEGLKTFAQTVALKDSDGGDLTGADFPKPGVYVYRIKEDGDSSKYGTISDNDTVRYSDAEYEIQILVTNENGTLVVDSFATGKVTDDGIAKTDAVFENIYQRDDGTPTPDPDPDTPDDPDPTYKYDAFEVFKKVTGDLGDETEYFEFTLTVTRNATEIDGAVYTGKVIDVATGEVVTDPEAKGVTVTFGDKTTFTDTFKIKHGQKLAFDKFPVGTTYKVSETVPNGYQATVDYVAGETSESDVAMTIFEVKSIEITEGDNKVDVENNKASSPLTGIVTDNLSFILLIVVAAAGMTAYVVLKRRLRTK